VDATKPITKYALEWALTNVMVRPGESITFLALHPPGSHGTSMSWWTWQEIKVMRVLVDNCISVCRMWVSLALAEISTLHRLPLTMWHPTEWHSLTLHVQVWCCSVSTWGEVHSKKCRSTMGCVSCWASKSVFYWKNWVPDEALSVCSGILGLKIWNWGAWGYGVVDCISVCRIWVGLPPPETTLRAKRP